MPRLSAVSIPRIKKQGLHSDGQGLYLRVTPSGGKFWMFRFTLRGKAREMGLGAFPAIPLTEARDKAIACRNQLNKGIDPIEARKATYTQKQLEEARSKTFKQCAESYITAHQSGWRNAKHAWQWQNTLERFAYPIFGDISVQEITVGMVIKVLEPLWNDKTETASRLRGRIESILDWATTREYRKGENPARWRGHLENLLPKRSKVQRIKHQPALPYDQIGDFMAALDKQGGTAAQALAFTILTATRTDEVIKARWDEIDLAKGVWVLPPSRTKAEREHRVTLSKAAIDILKKLKAHQDDVTPQNISNKIQWVFSGLKPNSHLSNLAMLVLIRRMNAKHDKPTWVDPKQNNRPIVVHGFRSSFRDWASEQTNFPREVAEAALAHAVGDKVEAAYRRGDLFEKRRQVMDAWARYCATPSVKEGSDKVVAMQRKHKA